MIEPTETDVGRLVVFRIRDEGHGGRGVITSFNDRFVFVRYGADTQSKATLRQDLEWVPRSIYKMIEWILIFSMYLDRGGGPATARFSDKAACEFAIKEIERARGGRTFRNGEWPSSSQIAICVPSSSAPTQ